MFILNIVTPNKKIVAGAEMEEVFVPAYRGQLNILPGHAPLVSTLQAGVLSYRLKGSDTLEHVAISWGYVEVTPSGVNVLAETAEQASEIDLKRAQNALRSAEDFLDKEGTTPEEIERYHRKRLRAEVRISVTH